MYHSINFNDFVDAFARYDRQNQFSYEAKRMIFDYIEEYEIESGEPVELDVIAICCDFNEMELKEVLNYYNINDEVLTDDNEAELLGEVTDYLSENTLLLGLTPQNTFVFQSF